MTKDFRSGGAFRGERVHRGTQDQGFPTHEPTLAPTDFFGNTTNTDYVYIAIGGATLVILCVAIYFFFFHHSETKEQQNTESRRRKPQLFVATGSGTESTEGSPLLSGQKIEKLKGILTGSKNKGMVCKILQKNKKEEGKVDMVDALLSIDVEKKEISWVKNAMLFVGEKQAFSLENLQRVQIGKFSEFMKKLPTKEQLCLSLVFESASSQVLDLVFDDETKRNDLAFGFQEVIEKIKRNEAL